MTRLHRPRRVNARSHERRTAFAVQHASGMRPKDFPSRIIAQHRAIEGSPERARRALNALPRAYVKAIRAAAFGYERGRPRDCTHLRSRRVIALATSLWELSARSKRHGFRRVVSGYTERMLAWLSWNPRTGKPCTRSALTATSWGKNRRRPDDCGILVALRRGLDGDPAVLFAQQPREDLADTRYMGPPKEIGRDPVTGAAIVRRFAFVVIWWRTSRAPPEAWRPPKLAFAPPT